MLFGKFKLILQVKKIPAFRQRSLSSDTVKGEVGVMVLQENEGEAVREPAAGGGSIDSAAQLQQLLQEPHHNWLLQISSGMGCLGYPECRTMRVAAY